MPLSEIETTVSVLQKIRETSPLILSLTNSVVQNISANLLLAIGAAPVMLCDAEEIEELLGSCASGLLINLGTLSREQTKTMSRTIAAANSSQKPWVLDPVAVGGLSFRTEFAYEILKQKPTLIRGNASEILALAGFDAQTRGPESLYRSDAAVNAAQSLAEKTGSTVLVTGEIDYVTDGKKIVACGNGNPLMTRVTGVGCSMGALAAACLSVAENAFDGAVATALILGVAGEIAVGHSRGSGSFAIELLDALYNLSEDDLRSHARILL